MNAYTDLSFWQKMTSAARKAGKEVAEKALILYYVLNDEETPKWAKTMVVGALAYFILPVDAVPDLIPLVGYTDDFGVLAAAFATVAVHVKKAHIDKAKEKMTVLFGANFAPSSSPG